MDYHFSCCRRCVQYSREDPLLDKCVRFHTSLSICIGSLTQDFTLLCVRHIGILFYPRLHYQLSIKFKMYMMINLSHDVKGDWIKRTCQSRWVHYMHKGQTPNHRTDLVWPQARPSRNHWPSWRHQRRFEKVKVKDEWKQNAPSSKNTSNFPHHNIQRKIFFDLANTRFE